MYSYDARVSFSMVDANKNLTFNKMVDFFQDAATFHSEDIGCGYTYLVPRKLLWVVNSWQIDVIRFPKYLERIKIVTIPYKFRGFLGYRNYYIENEEGEILVKGDSMWSLINFETFKPMMADEDMINQYGSGDKIDMDYQSGKIKLPAKLETGNKILVDGFYLDPNKHMNNGKYIDIATSNLPENFEIHRLRAEYRKQAFSGDILHPVYGMSEDGKWITSIGDAEGKPYAVVELS